MCLFHTDKGVVFWLIGTLWFLQHFKSEGINPFHGIFDCSTVYTLYITFTHHESKLLVDLGTFFQAQIYGHALCGSFEMYIEWVEFANSGQRYCNIDKLPRIVCHMQSKPCHTWEQLVQLIIQSSNARRLDIKLHLW